MLWHPHCWSLVVQVLVVRVDIGDLTYTTRTSYDFIVWEFSFSDPGCQAGNRRVNIGMVTYKAVPPHCMRSVIQVLVVRVDKGVVIYEAMTACVGGQWSRFWLSEWIIYYRSGGL